MSRMSPLEIRLFLLTSICSAAAGLEANLVDTTPEFYAKHFDCNVRAPLFLTKACVPHFPKGGRIVFISSAGARMGVAGQTVYAATKAANESFSRVWAKELGQSHGVTVNCVNPGPIATGKPIATSFLTIHGKAVLTCDIHRSMVSE